VVSSVKVSELEKGRPHTKTVLIKKPHSRIDGSPGKHPPSKAFDRSSGTSQQTNQKEKTSAKAEQK
jgi:hypothetical protein